MTTSQKIGIIVIGSMKEYTDNACILKNIKDFKIVALSITDFNTSVIDNHPNIQINNIPNYREELIVLLNRKLLPIVKKISQCPILPIEVIKHPSFTYSKWNKIRSKKLSIVSMNCWGGITYSRLGLEFNSPFINMFIKDEDFVKLCVDLKGYLESELIFDHWEFENNLKRDYPVCKLGDILIYCNHYVSYEEIKKRWAERIARFNYDAVLIIGYADNMDVASQYELVPYDKIVFSRNDIELPFVVNLSKYVKNSSQYTTTGLANYLAMQNIESYDPFNLILYYTRSNKNNNSYNRYIYTRAQDLHYRVVEESQLFDKNWYLQHYSDKDSPMQDPVYHYLNIGFRLGYDPSPNFSSTKYLINNPDVKKKGINPLVHYELWGKKENRKIN